MSRCLLYGPEHGSYPFGVMATLRDSAMSELHGPYASIDQAQAKRDDIVADPDLYDSVTLVKIETPIVAARQWIHGPTDYGVRFHFRLDGDGRLPDTGRISELLKPLLDEYPIETFEVGNLS